MKQFRKISFLLEEFQVPSTSQQLLDRFLIGYPRDGAFHRFHELEVSVFLLNSLDGAFCRRVEDYGLKIKTTAEEAARDSDAIVIIPRGGGAIANDGLLE